MTLSDRYVLMQSYSVKNISGGPLGKVRFYHFLHGLKTGISLYDNRPYPGKLSEYRYDNTQRGTSLAFNRITDEIFSLEDTVCMHAMDVPAEIECDYYGKEGVDSHEEGKPSVGAHLSVEANDLNDVDFFDPPEQRWVSGAMCFDFPDLAMGESHDITVLLSIRSVATFAAPAPNVRILDARIEGTDYIIEFEETTGAPVDGFLLRTSKDMSGSFPMDWPSLPIPRFIDVPYPGASRYTIPIDLDTNPSCFFVVQPFLE
jgi:hypothetical protein